ncbi:MAG: VWA domain-containing protein [Bryobacteraceae bacterium]
MQFDQPRLFVAAATLVFLLAQTAAAQQYPHTNAPAKAPAAKSASKAAPIHVNVNEVIVPVSVTDDQGRFVTDLQESDFKLFEDNRPQEIRYFSRARNQPVVIGFLLDLSSASRLHWKHYQAAAIALIQNLLTNDTRFSGYLIGYDQEAQLLVNTTNDPGPLVDAVRHAKPGGGAALYNAIHLACTKRRVIQGEPFRPRRVIIVIGDGHDDASKYTLDQAVELAQRNLVTIYCISTEAFGFTNPNTEHLVRLAQATGGRVVYPLQDVYSGVSGYLSKPQDAGNYELMVGTGEYRSVLDTKLYHAVTDVVGSITMEYILRYVSSDPTANNFRHIRVMVDLGNVHVRARAGYYANPVPGSETASHAPTAPHRGSP